jgi:type I restriction enzyme S subunit
VKYARYPKYKPSGVEWLGNVPTGWNVKRLKLNVRLGNEKGAIDDENPLPFVGLENVESWTGKLLFNEDPSVSEGVSNFFKSGNTLFGKLRPYLAKACNVDFDGFCSSDLLVMKEQKLNRTYLLHTLLSEGFIGLVDSSSYGVKMPRASWDFIGSIGMPVPSEQEQEAIASFLDRKTTKIDALVAKRRKLIDKLKEKRTALISRTVTRGLPPDVAKAAGLNPHPKLKPSGVEWLGEIPEHWEVKQLRYVFRNLDHRRIPIAAVDRALLDKTFPYYGASGIIDYVDDYLFDQTLILVAEDGANLFSRSTPLAFQASGKYWVNNHAHILRPWNGDIRYWTYLLQMHDYTPLVTGAAQPKLTAERLSSIRLPKPSESEQRAIANYLDQETAKIDQMVEKVEVAIAKIQEYRTALITAAVTGKIDVRKAS